ncbi:MAG: S1C family serine protease [Patescibacteria group bacterium]|nr:S1C family serine protease [Patescibacteria group bacterium]
MNLVKKLIKIVAIILLVILLGGISGVFGDRILMPWLSSFETFSRLSIFQKANEKVTVINKTEQITVKEDFSVTKTAKNVIPSVVSIITYEKENVENSTVNIRLSNEIREGVRTGLILTSDGLIMSVAKQGEVFNQKEVTNKQNKVLVWDGREFDAEFVTNDPYAGLVFYKIDAMNLPAPPLGNSDELESGEKIVLVGNSGGEYQNTFSVGVINQRDKSFTLLNSELSFSDRMEGAILTDAHIQHDNLGGPVVDFNGTVVGIVNQVEKNGDKIGFIVPMKTLKNSIDAVIRNGEISRAQLGAYYLSIDREIALLSNLPVNEGALIYSFSLQRGLAVIKNSAADIGEIELGDIVTKVNDDKITLDKPLSVHIAEFDKEEKVILTVLRKGKEIDLEIVLQ